RSNVEPVREPEPERVKHATSIPQVAIIKIHVVTWSMFWCRRRCDRAAECMTFLSVACSAGLGIQGRVCVLSEAPTQRQNTPETVREIPGCLDFGSNFIDDPQPLKLLQI